MPWPTLIVLAAAVVLAAGRMRVHGVSNMPEPDSRGHLDIGPGTAVGVDSPRFQVCTSRVSP